MARLLFLALLSAGVISGCALGKTIQAVGVEYPIERVVSIRPGMSEEEVVKFLGKPYAEEKDLDGNALLHYEYVATSQTALAVGLFVVGVTGTQSRSGGKW